MTLAMRDLENQQKGIEKGRLQTLIGFVKDKTISLERAAAEYGVSIEEFITLMNKT